MCKTADSIGVSQPVREPIAVIGVGCRFPGGVDSAPSFWQLLLNGVDAMTDVPSERWEHALYYHPEPGKPGKTVARQAGFVSNVDRFDPAFFGISPREASQMDPQHRLMLEVSWEALEDAGLPLERIAGAPLGASGVTGVFVGVSSHEYALVHTLESIGTHSSTGQAGCMAANRISYAFDLVGPSVAVDTACSSALTAVHLACVSLRNGESSVALAGGVNIFIDPTTFVSFSNLSMLSPDSRCQAFDARANGFARGEGAGVVVLKPLSRALADGDRVYAVILGSGVNQDGHSQGLTFPSLASQEKLLQTVYAQVGMQPSQVCFVEAHGTGTAAGDPVEATAIGRVLGQGRMAGQGVWLGSVKTNIGHLEAAAGIAGLIKACLALHHRLLPRNLHFEQPNPRIPFADLGLRVPITSVPLDGPAPLVAGVNSFGFGGANAHVILAEAPAVTESAAPDQPPYLLTLSAKSPQTLQALAESYQAFLGSTPASLLDICRTASVRRTHHPYRLGVTGSSVGELKQRLQAHLAEQKPPGVAAGHVMPGQRPRLAFVFSGQGTQWWGMGRELIKREPVFRDVIERCEHVIQTLGGWSLLDELGREEVDSRMHITAIAQPALFAIQAGLTALWRSWGIVPEAVVGHSVGEIAAAHAAGVMELEEAARVAFHRGRVMERASSQGKMLAVGLSEAEVVRYLVGHTTRAHVAIAAINSPSSLTLSGDPRALQDIAQALEHDGVFCRFLRVEYAFHSPHMDPVQADILRALADLAPRPAFLRLASSVTGDWASGQDWNADYVWRNLRQTVRFADAVGVLIREGYNTFVEIGPHPALVGYIQECLRSQNAAGVALASLHRGAGEAETLLNTLSQLYTQGVPICWEALYPHGQVVTLPAYPWQREHCWSEAEERRRLRFVLPTHPLLGTSRVSPHPAWANHLDARLVTYLSHHRLQGTPLLPATAYLEMALVAGQSAASDSVQQLEQVTFENACFLPTADNAALPVECHVVEAHFEILSRRESKWTRHAAGKIVALPSAAAAARVSLDDLRERLAEAMSSEAIYAAFSAVGLDYGASFRGIRAAWRKDGEALGEIVLPAELEAEQAHYQMHPALLDACFHVILAALPQTSRARRAYLPVAVDRLRFLRRPGTRVYSHVRLVELTDETLSADIQVFDENGECLIDLKNLRCRALAGDPQATALDDWLYVSEWRPQPRPVVDPSSTAAPESWLIFVGSGECRDRALTLSAQAGMHLSERLQAQGHTVRLVRPGAAFSVCRPNEYVIDPRQPEDMRRLIQAVRANNSPPLTQIVYLWALDAAEGNHTTPETLELDELLTIIAPLYLMQALAEWPDLAPPRLVLVTSRAQPRADDDRAHLSVAQSPLWGLRRVAAFEQPRLRPIIVDMGSPDSEVERDALLGEIASGLSEDEIVLRGDERYVHRYTRTTMAQCTPPVRRKLGDVAPCARMFRARMPRLGALDQLELAARPLPAPASGEVRIEMKAAGLNFSDVLKALGLYPGVTASTLSLGAECAGLVTAMGAGMQDNQGGESPLRVGDPVVAIAPHSFGSSVITPAVYALPIPTGLTFEQAAAIPIAFVTAQYALVHIGRLGAGERVLIHSATGGVGLAAIQIARRAGAEIFATAGNPDKREFLRSLGIQHVMDSRSLDFADQVLDTTNGEGVDLVLNSLAGEAIPKGLSVLRPFGRFVEIGKRDVYADARLGLRPFRNNISFAAIDLDQAIRTRPSLVAQLLREVLRGFEDGVLVPLPVRTFPLDELADALRYMSKAQHMGKIVIGPATPQCRVTFPHEKLEMRADATYLVTGGLGGLGRAAAEWLAQRGARHLVLVSRRGPDAPSARETVAALAAHGCHAWVWAADVTQPEDVRQVLNRIAAPLPPLRGVIHTAMVIDAGVITRLDGRRVRAVTRPKVLGAWNLHAQTLGLPLDFFVMMSSMASIYGSPGQANYAAANAFLDALAHYRRGCGLPALTLNLGTLGEVGHVAQHPELMTYLTDQGFPPMSPADVLSALEPLLGSEAIQVGVARLDWRRLGDILENSPPPRFSELLVGARGARKKDSQLLKALERAAPGERDKLLLATLIPAMSRVLGVAPDRFEADRPLGELGFDSLMTVELGLWVEETLGCKLPAVELMRNPTTTELAHSLVGLVADKSDKPAAPVTAVDLAAEAQLDPGLVPHNAGQTASPPIEILLTGATGFLGAFLLHELLAQTLARVHCLVRAHDADSARERLRATLEAFGLWDAAQADRFANRVVAVPGDLAQPRLSLATDTLESLADGVDAIYHAGAVVNLLRPYAAVRAANVQGTQEILGLACRGRPKALHYISTVAVFSPAHRADRIEEETIPAETAGLPDGYSQSKWVAEQLVLTAMRRGLGARIYRPGILAGHSQTGVSNLNDVLLQLFAATCRIGLMPDLAWRADVTPVDVAARAIIHISARYNGAARVFHVCNPEPTHVHEIMAWMRSMGYSIETTNYARWRQAMLARASEFKFEQLLPLLPEDEAQARERLGAAARQLSVENTRSAVQNSPVSLRPLDPDQLAVYVRYLEGKGLLRKTAATG
jgi:thioester reductase-like protein